MRERSLAWPARESRATPSIRDCIASAATRSKKLWPECFGAGRGPIRALTPTSTHADAGATVRRWLASTTRSKSVTNPRPESHTGHAAGHLRLPPDGRRPVWGRVDEVNFLDRLYDLDDLPTTDSRE